MYRLDKNECRRTLVRWICQRNEMKIRETNERVKAITERLDTINKTEQARFEQKLQQEMIQQPVLLHQELQQQLEFQFLVLPL